MIEPPGKPRCRRNELIFWFLLTEHHLPFMNSLQSADHIPVVSLLGRAEQQQTRFSCPAEEPPHGCGSTQQLLVLIC
ncbi:hypothetical protein OJAV_G00117060 [Oryzias javanicus]|uniref:Uncharacterized protein n=1 Tax=Oryzias javanicus TaxID=123683 RepID=A0A3S2MEA0_ORYJA|nr:hypothetical protein OJAV_G00117060 [Oryzias javanicus]